MSKINEIFMDLGMKESLLGTAYLRRAVDLYVPGMSLTKELYPAIAEACGTSASRCERAMRHAIEAGFNNVGHDVASRYFGNTISYETGKVTVGEFVARMAVLRHEN